MSLLWKSTRGGNLCSFLLTQLASPAVLLIYGTRIPNTHSDLSLPSSTYWWKNTAWLKQNTWPPSRPTQWPSRCSRSTWPPTQSTACWAPTRTRLLHLRTRPMMTLTSSTPQQPTRWQPTWLQQVKQQGAQHPSHDQPFILTSPSGPGGVQVVLSLPWDAVNASFLLWF